MTDSPKKNTEELTKNEESAATIAPEIPKKSDESPKKEAAAAPAAAVEEDAPAPKSRGRPRGSRDTVPRVKRVPVAAAVETTEEDEEEATVKKRPPTRKAAPQKRVQVVAVEEEEEETDEEEAPIAEPPPPRPKSPRTLRKERMQAHSNERRAMELARQARYDSILDNFMGY